MPSCSLLPSFWGILGFDGMGLLLLFFNRAWTLSSSIYSEIELGLVTPILMIGLLASGIYQRYGFSRSGIGCTVSRGNMHWLSRCWVYLSNDLSLYTYDM